MRRFLSDGLANRSFNHSGNSPIWRSQGVTIPLLRRDKPVCVHEHLETKILCTATFFMSPRTEFTTLSPPLHNSYVWIIIPDSAYVCANGLLDTGSLTLIKRLTSRSRNGNLVEVVGFEPTAFLMWRIYSPLPSTNSAHTSI